jgi:hypothetical protein
MKTTDGGGYPFGMDSKISSTTTALKIYPNPSFDRITIETSSVLNSSRMSVLNLNGQEILCSRITDTKILMDISHLPAGIYIVRLMNDAAVQVGKLVKQ